MPSRRDARLAADVAPFAAGAATLAAMDSAGVRTQAEADGIIDEVLQAAELWHRGEATLAEIRATFTAQQRFLAGRFVRPHPPALAAMFTALVADAGDPIDRLGRVWPLAEIAGVGRSIAYEDRIAVVRFVADPAQLRRREPDGRGPDRSDLATRPAWRAGRSKVDQ